MAGAPPPLERTETRILDIAAAHIRSAGEKRLTVVAIAETAGMSHANIYRYFASKAALIDAVTGQWLAPLEASLRSTAEGPDPATDKLERLLATVYRAYRDKLEADEYGFRLFARAVETGRAVARRHRGRLQSEVQRAIDQGVSGGEFLMRDQRRAASLVFDALNRFTHPCAMVLDKDVPRAALDQRFETMVRLAVRALRSGRVA